MIARCGFTINNMLSRRRFSRAGVHEALAQSRTVVKALEKLVEDDEQSGQT